MPVMNIYMFLSKTAPQPWHRKADSPGHVLTAGTDGFVYRHFSCSARRDVLSLVFYLNIFRSLTSGMSFFKSVLSDQGEQQPCLRENVSENQKKAATQRSFFSILFSSGLLRRIKAFHISLVLFLTSKNGSSMKLLKRGLLAHWYHSIHV